MPARVRRFRAGSAAEAASRWTRRPGIDLADVAGMRSPRYPAQVAATTLAVAIALAAGWAAPASCTPGSMPCCRDEAPTTVATCCGSTAGAASAATVATAPIRLAPPLPLFVTASIRPPAGAVERVALDASQPRPTARGRGVVLRL